MCEITIQVNCPYCHSLKVVKNGVKRTGKQNFLCRSCGKQFQFFYQKPGCRPAVKALVLRLLVRNSGIRDIEQVTGGHRQTVLRWLNQKAESCQVRPSRQQYRQVQLDEVWTFVGQRKKRKRWLFYAYAPETDEVLAWSWGNRSQRTVNRLYRQLQTLTIDLFCTDDWPAFAKVLPEERHLVGKAYTRNIEGVNLCLRTRNRRIVRKTACFSKKEQNHYNAMKLIFYYRNHHTL
ncbi:IS1 family transposase [Pontibacter ummariensis]|uniref:Transposase and inactivated derivatives, IS1 family n=1 Tax=Pontibacter ummariensis TaxID=1610492 RepID=A0A239LHX4_9BACT|nr:IS1 family transposase [Pontibacter ummariensis]PRY03359.1 IS1 family transposase [Pontibacter ummariensis]SNT29900.1 Transposase and inactivated derivatives, IS1 family [Pontibacter ummariensis]